MDAEPGGDDPNEEGRWRILIVDPDPAVAEAVALALRRWARVEWVTSGMAGLMLAAKEEVELAVIEADIPDMPSTEFLRAVRLLRPSLPIAIFATRRHLEDSEGGEADIRFSKPFELTALLAWITDHLTQGPPRPSKVESPPVSWGIPPEHLETVRGVLELIERHHRERAPLAVIAQAAEVSRSHLCRIFKRVTGVTLKRYLTRRRLQTAKELLLRPGMTIPEVARRVGYPDASHFDRVFRQWEGLTPSGYRRQAFLRAFRNSLPVTRNGHLTFCPPS